MFLKSTLTKRYVDNKDNGKIKIKNYISFSLTLNQFNIACQCIFCEATNDECFPYLKTSQLSFSENQLTGFYMTVTLVANGLTMNIHLSAI